MELVNLICQVDHWVRCLWIRGKIPKIIQKKYNNEKVGNWVPQGKKLHFWKNNSKQLQNGSPKTKNSISDNQYLKKYQDDS